MRRLGLASRGVSLVLILVVAWSFGLPCTQADVEGLGPPILTAPMELRAARADVWQQDGLRWMRLEGDVQYKLGAYAFEAERAVVRIDTRHEPGRTIRTAWVYLDRATTVPDADAMAHAEAPRLLVTSATTGAVQLHTNLLNPQNTPPEDAFVRDAVERFEQHERALTAPLLDAPDTPLVGEDVLQRRADRRAAIDRQMQDIDQMALDRARHEAMARADQQRTDHTDTPDDQRPALDPPTRVLPTKGVVRLSQDRVYGESRGDESLLTLIGDVRVLYSDYATGRELSLEAERVVIFIEGAWTDAGTNDSLDAERVRGIYLEGNVVATDGQYTIRSPRVYYDMQINKAVLLDAVFFTWHERKQVPLYLRAEALRQTSATSFEAEQAVVTTSEFARPHFAIGANRVTVDQYQTRAGGVRQKFVASDATAQYLGVPVFYWPRISGTDRDLPIKRLRVGSSSDNGVVVETTWDLFLLAGQEPPDNVDLEGKLDLLGDHNLALGIDLQYDQPQFFGRFDSYLLPYDSGTDEIGGRLDVPQDGDTRGFFQFQHRQKLRDDWEVSIETAFISDETFLEEFFPSEAYAAKPYETSLYVKNQQDDWALTFLTRYDINDFTPQTTLLQTPGYQVDKLPELGLWVTGRSFWDGRLTWFSENRLSQMRLRFGEDSPLDRGIRSGLSMSVFGIPNTTDFEDNFQTLGFSDDRVLRGDTRQELQAPLKVGILDVTPYVVGRVTAYDDDFEQFAGEDEQVRLWGQAGTRVATSFSKVYDGVDNRLLDLHRLRHIIEPSVNVFYSDTNIDASDLPVYDFDVERLAQGYGYSVELKNTFQTQRGGEGRWRSVDWLVITNRFTHRGDEEDPNFEIARFYDYRPEYSVGGDHFYSEVLWLVTDSLMMSGDVTYGFEDFDRVVQWRTNASLQHTPRFTTFVEYQEIDVLDSRLLTYGFSYQLTIKYLVSVRQRIDFARSDSRSLELVVDRKLPRWTLRVFADFDEVDDDERIGLVLIPDGVGSGARRRAPLGF